jgi:hypothetical protein
MKLPKRGQMFLDHTPEFILQKLTCPITEFIQGELKIV